MKPYIYFVPRPRRSRWDSTVIVLIYAGSVVISVSVILAIYTILR